jgi:hypothetical protein
MTETAWNACTDPQAMLSFLQTTGKASDRKLRLLAVACCRAVWRLFTSQTVRAAVEVSELYADGQETPERLEDARAAAEQLAERGFRRKVRALPWAFPVQTKFARQAAVQVASADIDDVLDVVGSALVVAARTSAGFERSRKNKQQHQADLLRCIFGPLPFRKVRAKPAHVSVLLRWNNGLIRPLAQAAYDERILPQGTLDPARLAVLCDALDEAGCMSSELLEHLRAPVPHVRGCFALDAILGKS